MEPISTQGKSNNRGGGGKAGRQNFSSSRVLD
jgi:hypothetical protein